MSNDPAAITGKIVIVAHVRLAARSQSAPFVTHRNIFH